MAQIDPLARAGERLARSHYANGLTFKSASLLALDTVEKNIIHPTRQGMILEAHRTEFRRLMMRETLETEILGLMARHYPARYAGIY